MADRTSAGIFGMIFELLAKNPTEEHKNMAKKIWPSIFYYDFSPYQMSADEALLILGLAKKGIDPEYLEDGEIILYANSDVSNFER